MIVIATIILGAIGSGLWEIFLAPIFNWFSDLFLRLLSSIFDGYVNSIYGEVGKIPIEKPGLLPFANIVVWVILLPWIFIYLLYWKTNLLKSKIENPKSSQDLSPKELLIRLKKIRSRIFWFLIPMAILATLSYSHVLFETTHALKTAIFIERSIEIIAPSIGENQRLQLRADYRAIDNAEKFYILYDKLHELANAHSVDLPEYSPIR